ncbi:up-regulator of cell proliferation-like [Hyperolius riggenbachi]|uniref:up-regulator of cell proliferation-like n=1 Tax=Hyperolius riggenbachi TaxID=752182 RepID=UPI0035A39996
MEMQHHLTSKLTLSDILSIGLENLDDKQPNTTRDFPHHYLKKLMALNRTAREIPLEIDQPESDNMLFSASFNEGENNTAPIHPLDVLCALLHCSDSFLQQEIVTKLSVCQFAVPLLLPAGDGSHCTLMLWAMRDIVKKWRPQSLADSKGFKEENVINTAMPIFSFVKLAKNKLSKSKILNQVLNPPQLHNDFFIHDNMEGGHYERKISDGLVELSWYFPSGKSDVFPEPIAVTNLRGDLASNLDQFMFLTRVSSAVFIFIESISEREVKLLSSCRNSNTQFNFIVTPGPGKNVHTETLKTLQDLSPILNIKQSNVIIFARGSNEAMFVDKLQKSIVNFLTKKDIKKITMDNLKSETEELPIYIDEQDAQCQTAREYARKITEEIKNVAVYKQKTMTLQGDLWKQLSKVEKELCRMTNQGGKDAQQYLDELKRKHFSLREKQHKHDLPHGIMLFVNAMTRLTKIEKQYFLKWMKCELDSIARGHLSLLQAEYKKKCSDKSATKEELIKIDQKISDSSLGIEHFLREMGQFYEAECSMAKENKIAKNARQFVGLPGIAADLLLDGFPLELVDGDASNIPLQWITDVLNAVDTKTGKKCRMRVITVLGVQSTGKSTLLNTMFGLQFPVASGRCTRGAFMTLLNVKENFQEELGCEFIMVIDTEGLKAPELASLEDSFEHDNELATLVVGLSNITVVNMAMENTTEMKDILQIVVHAFLRMKEVGKKPKCQFVHQNVSDVSAHDKNMRDRQKLLEQLNKLTEKAAEMEKKSELKYFSDVMNYNIEKDNWYIPGLWLGVPPMASVNSGYSEYVSELKKYLLQFMKTSKTSHHKPSSIPDFIKWIESLWNAVKHEKFIFSFRNSLVAEAYNKLSVQFSQWEWEFRKVVYQWSMDTETIIKNQSAESLNKNLCSKFKTEFNRLLLTEKNKMLTLLETYFDNKSENAHFIERHREDFRLSIESLKRNLEMICLVKIDESVSIQKGKFKIQEVQSSSQKLIEDKITNLLKMYGDRNQKLSEEELVKEFDMMWQKTLRDIKIEKLTRHNVSTTILQQLIDDMSYKGSAVNEELLHRLVLDHTQLDFKVDEKYIDSGFRDKIKAVFQWGKKSELLKILNEFAVSLQTKCKTYVTEKVRMAEDYNDTYCQELLRLIDTELLKQAETIHFNSHFELDIKRYILSRAAKEFQKMHDTFIEKNDPKLSLEKLKPQYLKTFVNTFQKKDISQTKAKEFCERCLKPAMRDYVFKQLGNMIVDDILQEKTFSSRTFFQSFLLKELLEEMSFKKYVKYICAYEGYAKDWILNYIENKYVNSEKLNNFRESMLSSVNNRVIEALTDDECLECPSISGFFKSVCEVLKKILVIPQNEINVITFQNTATVDQFSSDIQSFLKDTKYRILSELQSMGIKSVLSKVTVKPQDELFRKVVGCGKQCPFCSVPCEAGGDQHREHFATIHRSSGIGRTRWTKDKTLNTDICTTLVVSNNYFRDTKTEHKWHPYKEYRTHYPEWAIQPDPSIECSDYWKYILVQFNEQFAEEYNAKPANLPEGWKTITKEKALQGLKKVFNDK